MPSRKQKPIPYNVLPEFYRKVYTVDLSGNRGEDGAVIKPGKGKYWNVSMDVLDDDEAEALLDSVPEIREVRDLARAALEPFKEDNPDMRKTNGSGTIGLTWSLQRNQQGGATPTQLYFYQKKLGIILSRDYAGSFSMPPVMDAFFAEDAEVYNLDLEVTQFPLTHKAEGAAWWSGIVYFGAERSHLIEQMPIGRVPSYGLTEAQRTIIDRLVEKDPKHFLKYLLGARAGTEFEMVAFPLGKMTPEAAAKHVRRINAGLALHGHGDLLSIGLATQFTAGLGGGWEMGEATQFTAGPGGGWEIGEPTQFTAGLGGGWEMGEPTQFTAGPGGGWESGQATQFTADDGFGFGEDNVYTTHATEPGMLAHWHARTYFLIINHAFHCARTDERPPSWVSELLTPQKLAHAPLKTLEFQDSVRTGEPVQNLKIVGARINPGAGGWERKLVFDVQREDGGVGEWPSYDLAVSLKLVDPRSEPRSAPNRGGDTRHWQETLKPWPAFRIRGTRPVPSAPPPQQRGRLRRHPDHVDAASDSDISVEGGEQSGSDSDSDSDSSVDVPLASLLASLQASANRGKRARH